MNQLKGQHNSKVLLVVYHSLGGTTELMARAVARGAARVESVRVELKAALATDATDLKKAAGLALGTPEYFGYMAGAVKDLFDRTYYDLLEKTDRFPIVLFVSAGNDGFGALRSVERIAKGLKWRKVAEPVIVKGQPGDAILAQLEELGQTLAAGIELGIY